MDNIFVVWLREIKRKRNIVILSASSFLAFILWLAKGLLEEWLFSSMLNAPLIQNAVRYILDNPGVLIWLPIPLGIATVLVWMYVDVRNERKNIEVGIPELLSQMHKRLVELKDKAVKQHIAETELDDASMLLADVFNMVKIDDFNGFVKNMKKSIGRKKKMDRRQLARWVHAQIPMPQREWETKDTVAAGRVLDGVGIGLARLRDKDKKWGALYDELQSIMLNLADKELNELIAEHISNSYGLNSFVLYIEYTHKYVPVDYMPPKFIEGGPLSYKVDIDNEMTRLLTRIVNRIHDLGTSEAPSKANSVSSP